MSGGRREMPEMRRCGGCGFPPLGLVCLMLTCTPSSSGQRGCLGCGVAFAPPPPSLARMRLCPASTTAGRGRLGREGAAGRDGRPVTGRPFKHALALLDWDAAERGGAIVAGESTQGVVHQPQLKLTGFSRPEVPPRAPNHASTFFGFRV